ncbi:MAG: hypothetical protein D6726_05835, partial [Nitrospirae bacterium]
MRCFGTLLAVALVFVLLTTGLALSEDDPVLGKIGKWEIRLSDFEKIINLYDAEKQKAIRQDMNNMKNLLKRIVKTKLIADYARENGYTDTYEMKKQIELITNDMIAVQYLNKVVAKRAKVTEKEIEEYYKAHLDEFKLPERVRARHILIKVPKNATEKEK